MYAIALNWPADGVLALGAAGSTSSTAVTLLGYGTLPFKVRPTGGIIVIIPPIPEDKMPCRWGWVFRLTDLK